MAIEHLSISDWRTAALGRQRPLRTLSSQWPLSGVKQTLRRPYLRMIYDHNGAPDPGAARGKLTFPKLIIDPVCHTAANLKGPFLKFFLQKKALSWSRF